MIVFALFYILEVLENLGNFNDGSLLNLEILKIRI